MAQSMHGLLGKLRRRLLGISIEETRFERRGFRPGSERARPCLAMIPRVFAVGYHAALEDDRPAGLRPRLAEVEFELRGFAFEGAAMGLALLDALTPWRRDRVDAFLRGAGNAHAYLAHVGVGWAVARLHGNFTRARARLDPLLSWLVVDGYGFHEGFFHWPRYLAGQPRPRQLRGYELRAFDQGFGRSLWFIDGADVARIPQTIGAFPAERRADLWGGSGLAATYAGGVGGDRTERLESLG